MSVYQQLFESVTGINRCDTSMRLGGYVGDFETMLNEICKEYEVVRGHGIPLNYDGKLFINIIRKCEELHYYACILPNNIRWEMDTLKRIPVIAKLFMEFEGNDIHQ